MATMIQQAKSFTKANSKSGAKGLALILACIDHMFEHNDWTPLAWTIAQSEGADSTRFRAITNAVVGNVVMKADKKQPSGLFITMKENCGPSDKMQTLRDLVETNTSFRANSVKKALLGAPDPAEFNISKYATTIRNKLAKEEVSVADLMTAMSAL